VGVVKGGADLVDFGAVGADGFVEDLGGDVELVGPVGHVGGDFGVDLVGVVGALGVFFVGCVGFVGFGLLLVFCGLVFGHCGASCTGKKDVRGRRGDVLRGRREASRGELVDLGRERRRQFSRIACGCTPACGSVVSHP